MIHNTFFIRNIKNKRHRKIERNIIKISQNNATAHHIKAMRVKTFDEHIKVFASIFKNSLKTLRRIEKEIIKRKTNSFDFVSCQHWWEKVSQKFFHQCFIFLEEIKILDAISKFWKLFRLFQNPLM